MQAAQANALTKACKRASTFPTQRRISKFFPNAFKKIKHPTHNPTMDTNSTQTMVYRHGGQERQHTTAVWRNGGCSASNDSFVVGSSAVLRLNFCAKNPPLRQAAKRQAVKKLAFQEKSDFLRV